jgi:integrase
LEDLETLFDPQNLDRDKFKRSYTFWLPYLGLYTGARIEELCQLNLADIRQVGGILVFDINDRDEKRLKTQSSRRVVPVHPRLIELGLHDHVESMRKKGEDRLFPELKKQRDGYSQVASKWFGRYRQKHGIDKPFHSFRHTFIDELKQLDVDHKKIAALVGHKDESMTGGRYGKPYKPEILHPVVCMLDFGV